MKCLAFGRVLLTVFMVKLVEVALLLLVLHLLDSLPAVHDGHREQADGESARSLR